MNEQNRTQPPADLPARAPMGIVGKPWGAMDRGSYRPGYELTPHRLWIAYRQAEGGSPAMQCDAFEDLIENDGHLGGLYRSRMRAVANRRMILSPGGPAPVDKAAAEALELELADVNVEDAIWHSMDSLFFGYSGTEIDWRYRRDRDLVSPRWFIRAEHRRFLFDERNIPHLVTETNSHPGEALEAGRWIWAMQPARIAQRGGLMRTAAWWAIFKRMAVRDWIVFAEKFGIPVTIGKYEERNADVSRLALEQALDELGRDGRTVLAAGCTLQMDSVFRNGDVGSLHPAIAGLCNSEISKIFTGATLTTDTGGPGSFALGKVHENKSDALSYADAFWIERLFRRTVCESFVRFNPKFAGAKAPELYIHVQPEMDPLTDMQVAKGLQEMGMDFDSEDFYRRFGYRRPLSPAGTLKRPPDAAPAPRPAG